MEDDKMEDDKVEDDKVEDDKVEDDKMEDDKMEHDKMEPLVTELGYISGQLRAVIALLSLQARFGVPSSREISKELTKAYQLLPPNSQEWLAFRESLAPYFEVPARK